MDKRKLRTVALVPLRGESKSIPYKNIKEIAGKPLAYWVLKAASETRSIDEVYVSTEDQKIKDAVESFGLGVKVIDRPRELAGDLTTTDAVMLHFLKEVPDFDVLFTIQATSPLTKASDLDSALQQLEERHLDSLLTGVRVKRFFWRDDGTPYNYEYRARPMRQEFAGTIMENGAFYITKKEILERDKNRLGGKIGIYEMSDEATIELDEPEDWAVVEKILLAREREK